MASLRDLDPFVPPQELGGRLPRDSAGWNKEKAARDGPRSFRGFNGVQVCRGADACREIYEGPQPPAALPGSAIEPTPIATGCDTMPW
jgi:hypothetical protein